MASYTENYNLKKPAQDDNYNIDDFNGNADIMDAILAAKENVGVAAGLVTAHNAAANAHSDLLADYILATQKGVADGIAPLDATAKVPLANLPEIGGGLKYATLVVGNADAGHTDKDCDYLVPAGSTTANVQIQAAIDALPAGGGKIVVLEGDYVVGGTLSIENKKNITISGLGESSNIYLYFDTLGVSFLDFILITNSSYVTICNLRFTYQTTRSEKRNLFNAASSSQFYFYNNVVVDTGTGNTYAGNFGFTIQETSEGFHITNNKFIARSSRDGTSYGYINGTDHIFSNNLVTQPLQLRTDRTLNGLSIQNNLFDGSKFTSGAYATYRADGEKITRSNINISNNVLIKTNGAFQFFGYWTNISITDNLIVCYTNQQINFYGGSSGDLYPFKNIIVCGNIFDWQTYGKSNNCIRFGGNLNTDHICVVLCNNIAYYAPGQSSNVIWLAYLSHGVEANNVAINGSFGATGTATNITQVNNVSVTI